MRFSVCHIDEAISVGWRPGGSAEAAQGDKVEVTSSDACCFEDDPNEVSLYYCMLCGASECSECACGHQAYFGPCLVPTGD